MKLLNLGVLILLLTLGACSPESDNLELHDTETKQIPIYENGEIVRYADLDSFREPTDAELEEMYRLGWLSREDSNERAHTCEWSDGVGGSIDCTGGECNVVFGQNIDGSMSPGIGCYIDGNLHHSGAYRN
jgi:hypothetical protein